MPYITQEERLRLNSTDFVVRQTPQNGGQLNYLISKLCAEYIDEHGLRYQNISDVVGALEGAKMEFFRQLVNPYEELKLCENGGIPEYERNKS